MNISFDEGGNRVYKEACYIVMEHKLISELVNLRNWFRMERRFEDADVIRNILAEHHVTMVDFKDGTKWEQRRRLSDKQDRNSNG